MSSDSSTNLTAGEECQQAAKILSTFTDSRHGGSIPPHYIVNAMGIAIVKGCHGVAVVRLKTGDWSAPCAFALTSPQNSVAPLQETVLLFMTERSIISLVANQSISLGQSHSYAAGPLTSDPIVPGVDFYIWIRYNNGFTPEALIAQNLLGWSVMEDKIRHRKWHGNTVTWYDVLTNKISVDRSSVGNALYLVLNLSAGKGVSAERLRKNYVDVEALVGPKPSEVMASSGIFSVSTTVPSQISDNINNTAATYNIMAPRTSLSSSSNTKPNFQHQQPSSINQLGMFNNNANLINNPSMNQQSQSIPSGMTGVTLTTVTTKQGIISGPVNHSNNNSNMMMNHMITSQVQPQQQQMMMINPMTTGQINNNSYSMISMNPMMTGQFPNNNNNNNMMMNSIMTSQQQPQQMLMNSMMTSQVQPQQQQRMMNPMMTGQPTNNYNNMMNIQNMNNNAQMMQPLIPTSGTNTMMMNNPMMTGQPQQMMMGNIPFQQTGMQNNNNNSNMMGGYQQFR